MVDASIRIQRLEHSVRALKMSLCFLIGLLFLFLALGAGQAQDRTPDSNPSPQAIRAKSIQIVNDKGVAVCSIATDLTGSGVIHVKYADGTPLLSVAQGDFNQAGLTVFSRQGDPSAILREGDVGGGMLKLVSKQKTPVVIAGVDQNSNGILMLRSSDGQQVKEIGPR